MGCRRDRLASRLAFAVLHCKWGDEGCVASAIDWALSAGDGCGPGDLAGALRDPRVSSALERVGVSLEDLLERSLGDPRLSAYREALVEAVEAGAVGGEGVVAASGQGAALARVAERLSGVARSRNPGRRGRGFLAWRLGGLAAGLLGVAGAGIMAGKAAWMLGVASHGSTGLAVGAGLVFSAASAAAYAGSAVAGAFMLLLGGSGLGVKAGRVALLLALAGLAFSLLAAPFSPP